MLQSLYREYETRKKEIRNRLKEFSLTGEDDLFYELCFCLLTPQSNGMRCDEAVHRLKEKNFYSNDIDPVPLIKDKTRFHHTKAKRLLEMKQHYPGIAQKIGKKCANKTKREFLVEHVKGFGYKEASHYLRNIGHRNLAILDRHILKNLVRYGVLDKLPSSMNPKRYLEIEQQFKKFSKQITIPMDELDLLFWAMETGEVFK